MKPRTIIEKIWDNHVVAERPDAPALLYIDLHLVHEVTSPQAFDGLRARGLKVRRPDLTIATTDHSTPTTPRSLPILDKIAAAQVEQLDPELQGVRHPLLSAGQRQARHRARDRAGAGIDAARHDGGLRRQPHRHARRFGRAGVRHRHQRSGARAGVAVPAAEAVEDLSGAGGRRAEAGRDGEGHHSVADRADRHRRRHRLACSNIAARPSARSRWKSA